MLDTQNSDYLKKIKKFPFLSGDEEYILAKRWKEEKDQKAIKKILEGHLKLVAKIAQGYKGYGLPISDLIAEGNLGMMHAIKHYDPDRGNRFSTYAMWWIKANVQEYILKSWSLVKTGTTKAQKKLFFNLRKKQKALQTKGDNGLSEENIKIISSKLNVKEQEVQEMYNRLSQKDQSLNAPLKEGESSEWIEWIPDSRDDPETLLIEQNEMDKRKELFNTAMGYLKERERSIFINRRLKEPPKTLEVLSKEIGLSRERVRQLETEIFFKIQKIIKILSIPEKKSM